MPKISTITIYPLKSGAGIILHEAEVTDTGLANDREWMVVDADRTYISQREFSKLALVRPSLKDGALWLSAPRMDDIAVPNTPGTPLDCSLFGERCRAFTTSPAVDGWISDYLGVKASIVTRDKEFLRKGGVQYPERDDRPTSFVDNYGILIISQASLDDLNTRLDEPVAMDRFRPNVVIDGIDAYQEEEASDFSSQHVTLSLTNVCTRCVIPNIDQKTASVGREPFKTLSTFRFDDAYRGVRFGAYVAVASGIGAKISVGDAIKIGRPRASGTAHVSVRRP